MPAKRYSVETYGVTERLLWELEEPNIVALVAKQPI